MCSSGESRSLCLLRLGLRGSTDELMTGGDELSNSLGGAGTIFLYVLISAYGAYRRDFFIPPSPRPAVRIPYPNVPVNILALRD